MKSVIQWKWRLQTSYQLSGILNSMVSRKAMLFLQGGHILAEIKFPVFSLSFPYVT